MLKKAQAGEAVKMSADDDDDDDDNQKEGMSEEGEKLFDFLAWSNPAQDSVSLLLAVMDTKGVLCKSSWMVFNMQNYFWTEQ